MIILCLLVSSQDPINNSLECQTVKEREQRKKDEREKPLLFKRHKAVRFLISPKIKKVKIEVNKIMVTEMQRRNDSKKALKLQSSR